VVGFTFMVMVGFQPAKFSQFTTSMTRGDGGGGVPTGKVFAVYYVHD
jgi:hypothetical protein